MSSNVKKKQKTTFILVMLAFILPVVAAKFALDNDWFNRSATNRGELMTPALNFSPMLQDAAPRWRILYVMPEDCQQACENAVYSIHQVWLALGRETDRANATVIAQPTSDAAALSRLQSKKNIEVLQGGEESVNKSFESSSADGIFLVDTQNNAMLRYPLNNDKDKAIQASRDMLADLRKLLKLSRIG